MLCVSDEHTSTVYLINHIHVGLSIYRYRVRNFNYFAIIATYNRRTRDGNSSYKGGPKRRVILTSMAHPNLLKITDLSGRIGLVTGGGTGM